MDDDQIEEIMALVEAKYQEPDALQVEFNALKKAGTPLEALAALQRITDTAQKELAKTQGFLAETKIFSDLYADYREGTMKDLAAEDDEIHIFPMPEIPLVMTEEVSYPVEDDVDRFLMAGQNYRDEGSLLDAALPIGRLFEDMDAFIDEPEQPTRFFIVSKDGKSKKEAGRYLIGYTRGQYGETGYLPQNMDAFAQEHGLTFDGPVYCVWQPGDSGEEGCHLLQASVLVRVEK